MGTGANSLGSDTEEEDLKIIIKHRQNKSHHYDTENKTQIPAVWIRATRSEAILLFYLALAGPLHHVSFGMLH